jgi:spermidine synthase
MIVMDSRSSQEVTQSSDVEVAVSCEKGDGGHLTPDDGCASKIDDKTNSSIAKRGVDERHLAVKESERTLDSTQTTKTDEEAVDRIEEEKKVPELPPNVSSRQKEKVKVTGNPAANMMQEKNIEKQRNKVEFLFREDIAPGLVCEMTLKRIIHSTTSEFQQIDVIETYFGKTLVTDGKTQSAEFDEFAYHESLVHPSILGFSHHTGRAPKSVFIGGGGELATAREVLKHTGVERVVMVDLDATVVNVCVQYLPEWGGEKVMSDPRLELVIGDAYTYLMDTTETFDVIIMDISDPIEAGPGIMLYTKELYEHASKLLGANGVFVTQAGNADGVPLPHADSGEKDTTCFGPICNTLKEVFGCVCPYTQNLPSFGSDWGFVMAFNHQTAERWKPSKVAEEWIEARAGTIDDLIDGSVHGGQGSLRMYDGITHRRMFALTKAVRAQLKLDTRIMTKDNPIFMY